MIYSSIERDAQNKDGRQAAKKKQSELDQSKSTYPLQRAEIRTKGINKET